MTTINCTENCQYQKDGHCTYELVSNNFISGDHRCIYSKI